MEGISDRLITSLDTINEVIADAKIKELSDELRTSIRHATKILEAKKWEDVLLSFKQASGSVTSLTEDAGNTLVLLNNTINDFNLLVKDNEINIAETITGIKHSTKRADSFLKDSTIFIRNLDSRLSILQRKLSETMQNLERSSKNLDLFLENLSDQPSQLIFAEPPPTRENKK